MFQHTGLLFSGGPLYHCRFSLKRSPFIMPKTQQELAAMYYGLNPVLLLKQINENLECLWKLAERPAYQQRKVKTYEALVT